MERGLDTRVVHSGERREKLEEISTVNPIYLSNTFTLDEPAEMDAILGGQRSGFTYSRHGNPTVAALADTMANLEQGEGAVMYGSGMAALQGALLACDLKPGDTVVVSRDLYGATVSLSKQVFGSFGIETQVVDMSDTQAVVSLLCDERVKAIVFESISNPLLRVANLPAILEAAQEHGVISIVDNTFATPYLCNPLKQGASMVVHSTTKYLNGHGDVMGGAVITNAQTKAKLVAQQKLTGGVLGAMEAWLTQRGLKTFALRFERQLASASELASRLDAHPMVARVHHPSLVHHPDHDLAMSLFPRGQGAVLSFEMDGGQAAVYELMKSLNLVVPGTTVGDVYSLLLYPSMASHRSLSPEEKRNAGITDGLVRLSVGIENVEDIWNDLDTALREAAAKSV
ncbi:aminotransferase class I/II-fold pyridoxal phosphate-dependent enzyme [Alicyclobacillus tolerans]|uniref:trans-sulfuration enzyme family protein n=1 Tax=Alicyclobacillus tolerans TaxID=90970 RepID=UPI001F4072F5|nr:aminotransferase class I/II-fold pyridoxal phosphate-dependent enzyme [Alicyclobacillus tolerans]MCF8565815.1 aminotransferase class I/II-fold pyridoxal phosphate-dependent enzyme [Alicyclobacillus tolerans]